MATKHRGYTIVKRGDNYAVKDPSGYYAWSEIAVNVKTAKKWIDAHLAAGCLLKAAKDALPMVEAWHEVPPTRANKLRAAIAVAERDL